MNIFKPGYLGGKSSLLVYNWQSFFMLHNLIINIVLYKIVFRFQFLYK